MSMDARGISFTPLTLLTNGMWNGNTLQGVSREFPPDTWAASEPRASPLWSGSNIVKGSAVNSPTVQLEECLNNTTSLHTFHQNNQEIGETVLGNRVPLGENNAEIQWRAENRIDLMNSNSATPDEFSAAKRIKPRRARGELPSELQGNGCTWKKYSQRVLTGGEWRRFYFSCDEFGCDARLHVDIGYIQGKSAVQTLRSSYLGQHNHSTGIAQVDLPLGMRRQGHRFESQHMKRNFVHVDRKSDATEVKPYSATQQSDERSLLDPVGRHSHLNVAKNLQKMASEYESGWLSLQSTMVYRQLKMSKTQADI
eukprot:TRINITY_DN4762_c0_g1_i3.p1 TRINITY_DN4762_c0_g1~~TRINITY_DN4762_c0_g1_i3.p1  ORF type:complete len:311 (+),score=10.20 TRINITY_DN4762_c0_g1_i3:204-1136(+)